MSLKVFDAISALKRALPQARLVTPEATEEYQTLNGSYLSGFESDLNPACIFLPKSSQEVAVFIQTIDSFDNEVKFAIRSAGQQPLPGCANGQDGITVDLRDLKGLKPQDGAIQFAAGKRWGSVYEYLEPLGLGVTGGKSTIGGGLSFYASREGLICDNVVNFEIAIASGDVINANEKENPDHWVTLRGGGNNFVDAELVDCTNKIITPGFIDTHRHGWQTVFKTMGSNTSLSEYGYRYSAFVALPMFTPDDIYISQLAGIHEALAAGVTSILDHAHHTRTREHATAGWEASVDSGARIFFAYTFQNTSTDFQVPQQIAHWRELAAAASSNLSTLCISYDGFATSPQSLTQAVVDIAKESDVAVLTTHQVEGPWLIGNTPEELNRVGILNSSIPIVISHSSFLTARGAQLLRSKNQHVSITAESEMHYGHLHPSSHLILDQASLGIDTHFTFSTDILTQARMWLQRVRERLYKDTVVDRWEIPNSNPMSVNQAFLLATRQGGLALGRNDLGIIAPNAKADIVVWDGRSPALLGWTDPIAAVILHASVGDIEHVLVDGNFVKRDKKLVINGYDGVQDRFLEAAGRIQTILKETPLPALVGTFLTGSPYGDVQHADVQRGEGTGYGPSYV
ncbi:Uu.00g042290.m01.CDS01 [Anthostomella pinea]|uniref:Uu.00g042290.m01.CDS01 n=1 Tax=Anthostomella pinea TaxID=933095 RepID=A0AAI8YE11_9PEZI|nr:Uu.00g042290.m01.CDS01 [Anthostomella pinea]